MVQAFVDQGAPFVDCTALLAQKPRLGNRLALNKAVRELKYVPDPPLLALAVLVLLNALHLACCLQGVMQVWH